MKELKFKCELLTDVILNVKSASEGANSTLDFIPGSCFLGIVAQKLYKDESSESMEIFHSGKVRFGDAHPSIFSKEDNKYKRSLRIPVSFFYAKGDSIFDACYVHHYIDDPKKIKAKSGVDAQLKQCRSGFYVMDLEKGYEVKTDKSFAIKSAYDRDQRRSLDSAMYGYESLNKGLEMLFSVEIDDETLESEIKKALVGEKRVGRSRTAQYGLVEISECGYDDVETYTDSETIVVYADSRLIFLDENGLPTFQPSVQQLLGDNAVGEIVWEDSQVRTFQYAPWNYKRQCYDTDRCGIEKGSVFVIKNYKNADITSRYVGSYRNEGFGKVIFNPEFLQCGGENGLSKCKFEKNEVKDKEEAEKFVSNSPLFRYLEERKKKEDETQTVYKNVNEFKGESLFRKEKFASQWGAIRNIALRPKEDKDGKYKKLQSELKNSDVDFDMKNVPLDTFILYQLVKDYISHGVKSEDWDGQRATFLLDFMKDNKDTLWESIINLASEMAKKCK